MASSTWATRQRTTGSGYGRWAIIRRAVALDKFVWEHRNAELLLKDGDEIRQIVLI
jgi:hypothetical protein